MQLFDLAWSIFLIVLAVVLAFSFSFFLITTFFFKNTYKYLIIISKMPYLSVNARHDLQVHSIGNSGLHNRC
jgi:hypothetical protein